MMGDPMRRRIQHERDLAITLVAESWSTWVSRNSRGAFDVYAANDTRFLMIQVKSTAVPQSRSSLSMCWKAIRDMRAVPAPPQAERQLRVWLINLGRWVTFEINDGWPTERADVVRALLKGYASMEAQ